MIREIVTYLRGMAQTCTRWAHVCPDVATAHALEEMAHDMMAKARELEAAGLE